MENQKENPTAEELTNEQLKEVTGGDEPKPNPYADCVVLKGSKCKHYNEFCICVEW